MNNNDDDGPSPQDTKRSICVSMSGGLQGVHKSTTLVHLAAASAITDKLYDDSSSSSFGQHSVCMIKESKQLSEKSNQLAEGGGKPISLLSALAAGRGKFNSASLPSVLEAAPAPSTDTLTYEPPPPLPPPGPLTLSTTSPSLSTTDNILTPSSSHGPRKMVAASRAPSQRHLSRTSSNRRSNHDLGTPTGLLRRKRSEDTDDTSRSGSSYHEGDELAGIIHSSDELSGDEEDDEGRDELNAEATVPHVANEIEVDSPPQGKKQEPATTPETPKTSTKEEISQMALSTAKAAQAAAQEHDMKMKARQSQDGRVGRRRSAPIQFRRQLSRMSLTGNELPNDLKEQKLRTSLTSIKASMDDEISPMPVEPHDEAGPSQNAPAAALRGMSSPDQETGKRHSSQLSRAVEAPALRPRRSGTFLSATGSNPRDAKDRNEKVRAAMSAMCATGGTEGVAAVVRRMPPPPPASMLSPAPGSSRIGRRNRKSLASLDNDRQVNTVISVDEGEEEEEQWVVTARKPPSLRASISTGSTAGYAKGSPPKPSPGRPSDEKAAHRTDRSSAAVAVLRSPPKSSPGRQSDEKAAYRNTGSTTTAGVMRAPLKSSPGRPCDEKAAYRTTGSTTTAGVMRAPLKSSPGRPSDEKAAYRSTGSITTAGAMRAPLKSSPGRPSDEKAAHRATGSTTAAGVMRAPLKSSPGRSSDEKAAHRTTSSTAATVIKSPPKQSPGRPSDEKAAYRTTGSTAATVMRSPPKQSPGRPSDEKAAYRTTGSTNAAVMRSPPKQALSQARPSDEKAAYRTTRSAAPEGMASAPRQSLSQARPSDEKAAYRPHADGMESTPRPPSLRYNVSSADSVGSGIDLDPELRDSIIARASSAHAARRSLLRMSHQLSHRDVASPLERANLTRAGSADSDTVSVADASVARVDHSVPADLTRGQSESPGRPCDEKAAYRTTRPTATDDIASTPQPQSSRYNVSSGDSVNSGIDLDTKTRNSIIAHSTSAHAARRSLLRRSQILNDSNATTSMESRNLAHAASMDSDTASAADARRESMSQDQPCDEKAAYHATLSSTVSSVARPLSKEKEDVSTSMPGAYIMGHTSTEEKGPSLASPTSTGSEIDGQDNVPFFQPLMTPDVITEENDNEVSGEVVPDLEAQAGVPVLLPGAWAIDGIGNGDTGYDSGVESTGEGDYIEDGEEVQPEIPGSTLSFTAPDTAFEAELVVRQLVEAEVLSDEGRAAEITAKHKRQLRVIQGVSVIVTIMIIIGIVLGTVLPGDDSRQSGSDSGIPAVIGWSQVGSNMMGEIDHNIRFGFSVSMSSDGNRLAIGMPGTDDNENNLLNLGSVVVMDFNGTAWIESGLIQGAIPVGMAGETVVISRDGTRIAVGSPKGGHVAVYEEVEPYAWSMVGSPFESGDENAMAFFGAALALSADGKVVAISDKSADSLEGGIDAGKVQVFREFNSTWEQVGEDIVGKEGGGLFGQSIAMSSDGKRIVASSLGTDEYTGSVSSFYFDGDKWDQLGSRLLGEAKREYFGISVALADDGSVMAVGSRGYSIGTEDSVGRARVFNFAGNDWVQMGQSLEGTKERDFFGSSVALSSIGDTVAIGGPENDAFGPDSGHVQVMRFDGSSWTQVGSDLGVSLSGGEKLGMAISLSSSGSRIALGAPFSNFDGLYNDVGQVRVFQVDEDI